MSNPFNMYDIFARLDKIQSSVQPKPEVLKEAVATATAPTKLDRVDEKYQGWKKTVSAIKKGGSAENPEAVAAAIGRKKYGKAKFQKAAAAGKKLGEASKPDFLDLDKDGNKQEPMKKAAKEKQKVEESKCMECGMWESKCSCEKEPVEESEKWIQKAIKKPGALHKQLGVPQDEKIPAGKLNKAAKAGGKLGQRARLAKTLKSFNEGDENDDLFAKSGDFQSRSKAKQKLSTNRPGYDELERRAGLGKNLMVKHGRDLLNLRKGRKKGFDAAYHDTDRDHEQYAIMGPKGRLPESDMEEGNAFGAEVRAKKSDNIPNSKQRIKTGGRNLPIKEKLSPGEMKAFAALAEPKNKVTYADKIAGAKKNKTVRMHEEETDSKKRSSKGTGFDPEVAKKSKDSKTTASGRHDISKSKAGGTVYSKRYQDDDDHDHEETTKSTDNKGRGRPKKHTDDKPRQERVTAKSRKKDRTAHGQSGFKSAKKSRHVDEMGYGGLNYESHMMGPDHGEYDREGDMAKDQLHTIVKASKELHSILGDEQNLPEWVQTKITKALDYINASRDYMDQETSDMDDEMIGEKAVSQQQQKFMGMVHAMQKGDKVKGASPELKKVARTMKKSDAEDFAKTKHKGLPKRVKAGKPVGEDGGPGGIEAEKPYRDPKSGKMITPPRGATNPPQDPVSPAKSQPKAPAPKRADADTTNDEQVAETDKNPTDAASKKVKGGGGMTFGKGIYDSMNRDLESMISENMNVSVNASSEGEKNITVNATEEDADALARLLMMAGINGHSDSYGEVCPSCGSAECECDMVDEAATENHPDYPENSEQGQDTEFMTQTISGGLNRRKPDITTLPATMVRPMEEAVENKLWQVYNNTKA